jgi:plastocyanin
MRRVFLGLVMCELLATAAALRVAAPPPALAAPTGAIRGRVAFLRDVRPADPRPSITELGMSDAHPHAAPEQDVAVVYLETAPRGAFEERPGPTVVLDQREETFVPHVLAITTGTTVRFLNSDKTYHNVFSLSRPKRFDLGRYPTGRAKSVRFERPGIVRVFCEIHSHMSAFILVFAHRHFAVTGEKGEYRIDGLPPGSYTVTVWHPVLAAKTRAVRIPDEGGEQELDFDLS